MSLPESEDRNPYFTVGIVGALRFKNKSYEGIAEYLSFNSVEEMRALLESWELPDWLVGAETNSDKKWFTKRADPAYGALAPPKNFRPLVMQRNSLRSGSRRCSKTPSYLNT